MRAFLTCFTFLLAALFPFEAFSQQGKGWSGYSKEKSGTYSKWLKKGNGKITADTGGVVFCKVKFLTENDSMFLDVNESSLRPNLPMRIMAPKFSCDFMEMFARLHVGDSAVFFVHLDSLKIYYPREFEFNDPPIDSMTYLGFAVSVDSIWSQEKTKEQQAIAEKKEEQQAEIMRRVQEKLGPIQQASQQKEPWLRDHNDSLFAAYLKANRKMKQVDSTHVYFMSLEKGKGAQVDTGMTVAVRYTGTYLDGSLFDSNELVPGQDSFVFEAGTPMMIPGFNIGIEKMHVGERARFIVPPNLAYNDGLTRIFEVEIISAKK